MVSVLLRSCGCERVGAKMVTRFVSSFCYGDVIRMFLARCL